MVPESTRRAGPYVGNGVTTAFPFTFKVFAASDLQVFLLASGVETEQTLNSTYSVTLNADQDTNPGGTINYPLTGSPLPAGSYLTAISNIPVDQQVDIGNLGGFFPSVIEGALDKAIALIGQLKEKMSRAIVLRASTSGVSVELPGPQANLAIGWNSSATALTNIASPGALSVTSLGSALVNSANAAAARTLLGLAPGTVNVKDYGAVCDGVTADDAAITALVAAMPAGKTTEVFVPATMKITTNIAAGAGIIGWNFAQGAVLTGGGSIPYHSQTVSFDTTYNYGLLGGLYRGTVANPEVGGNIPTLYVQRVDQSTVGADGPGYLIRNISSVLRRLAGGTGWLHGINSYVEDNSNTGTAQSVGAAGVAHATGNGAVWGLYGEAHARGAGSTATGVEANAYNWTGSDFAYNLTEPATLPFSAGVWSVSFGNNKNTFCYGVGSNSTAGTVTKSWRAGFYMQRYSVSDVGFDILAQPPVGIRFKYGASTDGTGTTRTGVGIDFGETAVYGTPGTSFNKGAMNLWHHALVFGNDGAGNALGQMYYNNAAGRLQFYYNGQLIGFLDAAGKNLQMNGSAAPLTVTAATGDLSAADTTKSVLCNRNATTITLTLPTPASWTGRELIIRNIHATPGTVISASANVSLNGSLSAALLAATQGKWVHLQSDGAAWIIIANN